MRWLLATICAALAATACGADTNQDADSAGATATIEAGTTVATTPPPPTEATAARESAGDVDEEFCDLMLRSQDEDLDVSSPAELEEALLAELDRLSDLRATVPDEVRDDFDAFLEASETSVELYQEYQFDLLSIPQSEIEAVQARISGPQERILEYCGASDLVAQQEGAEGDESASPSVDEEMPDGLFEPPGAQDLSDVTGEGVMRVIETDASFDQLLDYYSGLLGAEDSLTGSEGSRTATFSDTMGVPPAYVLWIEEEGDGARVRISTP